MNEEWSYLVSCVLTTVIGVIKMFQPETPVVIVARGFSSSRRNVESCQNVDAILTSRTATSRLSGELSSYLDSLFVDGPVFMVS